MPLSLWKKMTVADYMFVVFFDVLVFFAGYKFYEYRIKRSGVTPGSMLIER